MLSMPTDGNWAAPRLVSPVVAPTTSQLAADEIRWAIQTGAYLPGERLPAEQALADQLGIARMTLREAIRLLIAEDLLDVRRGAHGGTFVRRGPTRTPARLRRFLLAHQAEIEEILDYRVVVESAVARLAATRRTDENLDRLGQLLAHMTELMTSDEENVVPLFWRADHEFHNVMAIAARNAFLARSVEEGRVAMFRPLGTSFDRMQENANDGHAELVETIADGDPDAAAAAAADHVETTRHVLRALIRAAG